MNGENSYEWITTCFDVVCSNNIIVSIDKELFAPDFAEKIGAIIPDFESIAMPKLRGYIEAVKTVEWI